MSIHTCRKLYQELIHIRAQTILQGLKEADDHEEPMWYFPDDYFDEVDACFMPTDYFDEEFKGLPIDFFDDFQVPDEKVTEEKPQQKKQPIYLSSAKILPHDSPLSTPVYRSPLKPRTWDEEMEITKAWKMTE
jgi:hypothetical protein